MADLPDWLKSDARKAREAIGAEPDKGKLSKAITPEQEDDLPEDRLIPSLETGSFEEWRDWLREHRANMDGQKLIAGIALAGLESRYGAGTIENLARETGHGRSTLFEWRKVAALLLDWRGDLSAARTFDDFPGLTYSHLRIAVTLPYEDAIEAILSVCYPGHEDWSVLPPEREGEADDLAERRATMKWYSSTPRPVTVDHFAEYVKVLKGRQPGPRPIFDAECSNIDEALELVRQQSEAVQGKRFRVIIREVK